MRHSKEKASGGEPIPRMHYFDRQPGFTAGHGVATLAQVRAKVKRAAGPVPETRYVDRK